MAHEHLLRICAELKQQGKQPSVGLVKSKAGSAFQLAAIISAVQFFKANPDWQPPAVSLHSTSANKNTKNDKNASLEKRVESLESQVASLQQALDTLTKQLNSQ